jgi:anti-sigma B factor antagonist
MTRPNRDRVVVAAIGELDFATVPMVHEAIAQLREVSWPRIVLDLGAVTFMDSSGVHLMIELLDAAENEGFELSVVDGPPHVMRVLEITGISRRLARPAANPVAPAPAATGARQLCA